MSKLRNIVLILVVFVRLPNLNRASVNDTDYTHGQNKNETLEKEIFDIDPLRRNSNNNSQTRVERGFIHLRSMMQCGSNCTPSSYNGYGCYCGFEGSGEPVDSIDKCCQDHDNCDAYTRTCAYLKFYFVKYLWTCNEHQEPICDTDQGKWISEEAEQCARRLCDCDRKFVQCIKKHACPTTKLKCKNGSYFRTIYTWMLNSNEKENNKSV